MLIDFTVAIANDESENWNKFKLDIRKRQMFIFFCCLQGPFRQSLAELWTFGSTLFYAQAERDAVADRLEVCNFNVKIYNTSEKSQAYLEASTENYLQQNLTAAPL